MLGSEDAVLEKRLATAEGVHRSLDLYERGRGTQRLREVWNAEGTRALVTVLVRDANFVAVARLLDRIRAFETQELAPHGIRLDFGGDLAVSQSLIDGIVATQVGSLSGALLTIAVLLSVVTGSVLLGLVCTLPCALAIAVDFALMGFWGMPLGVATSMFAAMTLGLGVDWSIHLVRGVRRHLGPDATIAAAVESGFAEVGPAVTIDALSVAAGFGVMMASAVPPNRRLGFLLVSSLLLCLVGTMLLLPGLLLLARRGLARRGRV
jgi:predicted RND superfamily exporter protein